MTTLTNAVSGQSQNCSGNLEISPGIGTIGNFFGKHAIIPGRLKLKLSIAQTALASWSCHPPPPRSLAIILLTTLWRSDDYFVSNRAFVSVAFYDAFVDKLLVQLHMFHKKFSTHRTAYIDSWIETSYVPVTGTQEVFIAVANMLLVEMFSRVGDTPLKLPISSSLDSQFQAGTFQLKLLVRAFYSLIVC